MSTNYLEHLKYKDARGQPPAGLQPPTTSFAFVMYDELDAVFNQGDFMSTPNAYLTMPTMGKLEVTSAALLRASDQGQGQAFSLLSDPELLQAAVKQVLDKVAMVLDPGIVALYKRNHVTEGWAMLAQGLRLLKGTVVKPTHLCKPYNIDLVKRRRDKDTPRWEHHYCNLDGQGYLLIQLGKNANNKGVQVRAHRFICWAFHGPPPAGKKLVRHTCHHQECLNPGHMRWGSAKENVADARGPSQGAS